MRQTRIAFENVGCDRNSELNGFCSASGGRYTKTDLQSDGLPAVVLVFLDCTLELFDLCKHASVLVVHMNMKWERFFRRGKVSAAKVA
jgi:hypothetical protein